MRRPLTLLALASSWTFGCDAIIGLGDEPQPSEAAGGATGSSGVTGSTGSGGSSSSSGSSSTGPASSSSAGGAGGGDAGGGGTGGDACEFFAPPGTGGSGGGTGGAGGAGGCTLGQDTDCMACGHDCGPGANCDEIESEVYRCTPANLGAPGDTVSALAVGFGVVTVIEAPEAVQSVFRFPIDADNALPRDRLSACPENVDCADRRMAVADESGTTYIATDDGLLRCDSQATCVVQPGVEEASVGGLRVRGNELLFLRTEPSADDVQALSLETGEVTTLARLDGVDDAVALTLHRGDVVWTTGFEQSTDVGLARLGAGGRSTLVTGEVKATSITSDGEAIYWRQGNGVLSLAAGCTPRVLIAPTAPTVRDGTIAVDSTFVYFNYGPDPSVYRCLKDELDGSPTSEACEVLSNGASGFIAEDDQWVIYARGPQIHRVRKAP